MNLKKTLILSAVIFLGFVGIVSAEEPKKIDTKKLLVDEAKIIKPGVLPDSFWYWSDIFGEQLVFVAKVGKEKKGEYLLDLAEERLAEMRSLSEKGVAKYTEELLSRHQEEVSKAEEFLAEAKGLTVEEFKKQQLELEKEILRQEKNIKREALQAPTKYEKGQTTMFGSLKNWLAKVTGHLSEKKVNIEQTEAQMYE
ncbi:MAG: DUF5667 domain-containing protein [Patescibacteria group bacterium]